MKKALITGASSGIGLAVAKEMAAQGWDLLLIARRFERLQKIKEDLESRFKVQVEISPVDISDSQSIQEFSKKFQKQISEVTVLINNAGLAKFSDKLHEGDVGHWNQMIDVNVRGLLEITRLVLPAMVKRNSGDIVNLGSVAGRWVYPGGAVYCATKFAVRAISEGLRLDLLSKNIRVSNIEPGMVESEFSEVRFEDPEKAKAVYQGMKPLVPEDIAKTILWILNCPQHVNIQELVIFPTAQASVRDVARNS